MLDGFYIEILFAVQVTISVAIGATAVGVVWGLVSSLLEKVKIIGYIIYFWNILIRGIPELLVLFAIYFGLTTILSDLTGHYIEINALLAGIVALGIIFAAYASQVFLAAFNAIDQGEIDAAFALGMKKINIFTSVIFPQIWRHALPGLFNLWLVVLKDSSIVSLIGLNDMMNQAQIAANQSFKPFTYYVFAGLIYLILTALSQLASKGVIQLISRKKAYA